MRLKDRVAVVTGASRGIGRGIAIAFAREGAKVAVNYYGSREGAEGTAAEIRELGGEAVVLQADATNTEEMARVLQQTVEHFGRLDIYVNNANSNQMRQGLKPYLEVAEDDLYASFYLSFKAAYINGQMAAKQMIALGNGGRIINITSVHQANAWMPESPYGSMKAAIRRLTMSQALDLAPYRICANAIAPGFIDVRLHPGERGEEYDRTCDVADAEVPLGRGLPSDVAGAAVYLASDEARYVTGTCILVDGGMLISPRATV